MSLLRKLQLAESAPSINGKEVSPVLEIQKMDDLPAPVLPTALFPVRDKIIKPKSTRKEANEGHPSEA